LLARISKRWQKSFFTSLSNTADVQGSGQFFYVSYIFRNMERFKSRRYKWTGHVARLEVNIKMVTYKRRMKYQLKMHVSKIHVKIFPRELGYTGMTDFGIQILCIGR